MILYYGTEVFYLDFEIQWGRHVIESFKCYIFSLLVFKTKVYTVSQQSTFVVDHLSFYTAYLAISKETVENSLARGTLKSKPRSGRPRSTSSTTDHAISLAVKKGRGDSPSGIRTRINSALADSISRSTVYNCAHESGFDSFVCVKKPQLRPENIANRLQ